MREKQRDYRIDVFDYVELHLKFLLTMFTGHCLFKQT